MLKIIEILASVFLGNYFSTSRTDTKPPTVLVMEFLQSKSRFLILMLVACISLGILFSAGIVLSILGAAQWANSGDLSVEAVGTAQFLFFAGIALVVITVATTITLFVKSKNTIEEQAQPEPPKPDHPLKTALIHVLKDFSKEAAENAAKPANSSTVEPSPLPPKTRLKPSDVGVRH